MSRHTYTTTACRNCDFKTRKNKRDVPKLDFRCPVSICPKCQTLMIDPLFAEYEFMTDKEKGKFTRDYIEKWMYITSIFWLLVGMGILILFLSVGGTFNSILGLLFAGIGIVNFIISLLSLEEAKKNESFEQDIYVSLKRTSNQDYIDFLNRFGERKYIPFVDKEVFMEKYRYFEERESYKQEMEKFMILMESIKKELNSSEAFLQKIFRHTFP